MKDMGGKSHVVTFDRWRARRDFDPKRSSGKEMISVKDHELWQNIGRLRMQQTFLALADA